LSDPREKGGKGKSKKRSRRIRLQLEEKHREKDNRKDGQKSNHPVGGKEDKSQKHSQGTKLAVA